MQGHRAGEPVGIHGGSGKGRKVDGECRTIFSPRFPCNVNLHRGESKKGGGLLCCAREYLAVPMFLLGAEKGGGNGTFAAVPASFSFLPPLSGLCFRLTSFHPRRRRRQCAMLTFPPSFAGLLLRSPEASAGGSHLVHPRRGLPGECQKGNRAAISRFLFSFSGLKHMRDH